jgi:NitT/TauT family transport system permease protein
MELWLIALATLVTVGRIWLLIGLAILSGWGLAYLCIRSRGFENAFVPVVNVLESIPVLAFLPIVLVIFVSGIGGPAGVEVAVDFLVFDAVAWNIWIGAYQSFKTVPENLFEVGENYRLGQLRMLWNLYIPHSIPRISSNLLSSFADAFFYISVSEVFAVGIHTYSTFGIGTLITGFLASSDYRDLAWSLLFIGVAVVLVSLALAEFARYSVARYGVDTPEEIARRAGWGRRVEGWRRVLGAPGRLVSARVARSQRAAIAAEEAGRSAPRRGTGWWVALGVLVLLAAALLYGSVGVVRSVPLAEWHVLFAETPFLLYSMGVDYLRVGIVTGVALLLSITLGYLLATRRRLGRAVIPILQVVASYPVPTYFPLIFAATFSSLSTTLPWGYAEVYILVLAFLSCFYYLFFDFWIGVQAIPAEFWEVMDNYELGFLTRMRRVILPATFPYLVTGISSTVNSCWAGLEIGEFWPDIAGGHSLVAGVGMMKYIGLNLAQGNVSNAAWVSLLFGVVVLVYGLFFTRNLMDLARRKYVVEEGVYAA